MLVLTRKKGEWLMIGDPGHEMRVTVLEMERGKVRLGFEGAERVMRGEVVEAAARNPPQEGGADARC